MAFKTGLSAISESVKNAEKRSSGPTSYPGKIGYFNWQPGDKKILRFLTDETLTADFYQWILDRTGSTKTFLIDPDDPGRLKRYMSPIPGIGWRKNFSGGLPEQPKPVEMTVGIAVQREEVPNPNGKGLIIQDVLEEQVVDGTTYTSRVFGIVHQNTQNFWRSLGTTCADRFGTICDRDYEITRQGAGIDTSYSIIPLTPVPELDTVEKVQDRYFYGKPWDRDDPERLLKCPITIPQWIERFSDEERYQFWLSSEGSNGGSGLDEFKPSTTHNPAADEAQVVSPSERFTSLRETLLGGADSKK